MQFSSPGNDVLRPQPMDAAPASSLVVVGFADLSFAPELAWESVLPHPAAPSAAIVETRARDVESLFIAFPFASPAVVSVGQPECVES